MYKASTDSAPKANCKQVNDHKGFSYEEKDRLRWMRQEEVEKEEVKKNKKK